MFCGHDNISSHYLEQLGVALNKQRNALDTLNLPKRPVRHAQLAQHDLEGRNAHIHLHTKSKERGVSNCFVMSLCAHDDSYHLSSVELAEVRARL